MNALESISNAEARCCAPLPSALLGRMLAPVAAAGWASLESRSGRLAFRTGVGDAAAGDDSLLLARELAADAVELHAVEPRRLGPEDVAMAADRMLSGGADAEPALPSAGESRRWAAFVCRLRDGRRDLLGLLLKPGVDRARAQQTIRTHWCLMRSALAAEQIARVSTSCTAAAADLVARHLPVGILVLDAEGRLLDGNARGLQALQGGAFLRLACGQVTPANRGDARRFAEALRLCIEEAEHPAHRPDVSRLLCIRDVPGMGSAPVALFPCRGPNDVPAAAAALPLPPVNARISRLGLEMGLTLGEARAAALISQGLSNREAATRMGVTEQTFSTYAKRILGKLAARNRAELAHMLTWRSITVPGGDS